MAQTLEQLNAIRERLGQEPLTELPNAEKLAEVPEGEQIPTEKKPEAPAPIISSELTEEDVVKFLQKKGMQLSSLDELNKPLTEVDLQKQAEQRENDKLSYGLNKGLFNRKAYEQFTLDQSNKQNLVYSHYYQEAKKDDPELSDEDIQAEFAAKYGLDTEPATRKHKRGQEEIEILGSRLLQNKYPSVYKLDSEFDAYENQSKQQKTQEQKILAGAPIYKKDIDDVFEGLKKITTKFSDDESYDVVVLEESINDLKSIFLDKNYVAQQIANGYTVEDLKETAFTALLKAQWPVFAKEIVKQALLKQQKGVRGIPNGGELEKPEGLQLTEAQKTALNRVFPNREAQPIAN